MQWIITNDHIGTDCQGKGVYNRATENMPHRFKIYDGDGELYYEGRADDSDSQEAFEPLDWATGYAGATRIDYLRNGQWETL
jgi:hypothetical protein